MTRTCGRKLSAKNSHVGANCTCVPPVTTTSAGTSARSSTGRTVWATSTALPADPTSKRYDPPRGFPGANDSSVEPSSAPSVRAPQMSATARTAARCCRFSPGFSRPARMSRMRNARPESAESASAVRRICPPPSPARPSSSMGLWWSMVCAFGFWGLSATPGGARRGGNPAGRFRACPGTTGLSKGRSRGVEGAESDGLGKYLSRILGT